MVSLSNVNLQETLQAEFSPSLDTSLIAAIVADYITDPNKPPSVEDIKGLRKTLSDLAAGAEFHVHDVADDLANLGLAEATEDSYDASTTDFVSLESAATTNTAITSEFSNGSQSLSSPLRFLQTAFPHLPTSRLKSALGGAEDTDEIDMESIVESILATEYVRELEERGTEEGDTVESPWDTVRPRQVAKKQKRKIGKTITFGDVRQKQQMRSSSTPASPRTMAADPWTQLSSVASHLENLIPYTTASQFQSMFHSPQYSNPSEALRAALACIVSPAPSTDMSSEETQMLFGMFDILRESSAYQALPDIDREQMMSDAQLALRATRQCPDAALDVVWLLREVDGGEVDWGIYHSPVPTSPTVSSSRPLKSNTQLPLGPPTIIPPKGKGHLGGQSVPNSPVLSSPAAWQTVPITPRKTASLHADFIPAYKNGMENSSGITRNGIKKKASGHNQRAGELMQKRKEALRDASRAWQRGNNLTRGGEVAFYFAERARELQEQAQAEKLDATWDLVQSKRVDTENGSAIDLHGASVSEAVQIAKTVLVQTPATATTPLRIITGRGLHSSSGIGVLGPAVRNALIEDGWDVDKRTGGLIVRGRTLRQ